MARNSLDSSVIPEEHLQAPIAVESVTLETTAITLDEENDLTQSPTNESDCYLSNNATLALNQIQSSSRKDETPRQDGIDGSDQMMNPGAATPMSNAEIMNLLISRQKQEQEEQMKNNEGVTYERKDEASVGHPDGKKSPVTSTDFRQQDGITTSPSEFYATLENPVTQAYEVATYVTEDGQNGQVIITGGSSFSSDLPTSSRGAVSLGENNITTIELPDGQILSLGEEALAQIAGLGNNFPGGSIQLATAQSVDGTQQVQYIIKQSPATKDNHYESQHIAEKKTYQCEIDNCSKQFSTPYRLKAHGRTHSGDTYTCYVCRKPFGSQSDLQKHSKTHLGQKEFVCEVDGCKKEYTTAHHLKVHKRQHSGERPFVCEWEGCGKMFTTGYGLKSHFRTHTNERPYKCHEPMCTKAFKTSGDLQKHIRTHTGERPFVCSFEGCNRSFTTSNIRKVHLRTHTGEKPYKCEIENCGRTFASATNYKNHSRIHTGERPYVCEVPGCLKRFTEYSSLYKHNIVHTHQKPYTCTLCHKTYRQTSTLAMHKRTVHGTEDLSESEKQETARVPLKRSKMSTSSRLRPPSTSPASNSNSGYLQGMSLVINNTAAASDQQFTAELSTQHLAEAGELPGAIAIPIQVTMNPDGTIAGAQGLNLTDGNGRMIPVNLSVSIPMSSFSAMNDAENDSDGPATMETIYPQEEKMSNVLNILPNTDEDVSRRDSNAASRADDADEQNSLPDTTLISTSIDSIRRRETSSPTIIDNSLYNNDSRSLIRTELPGDNYDVDAEEGDVTDKYLTSHYRKDVQIIQT